MIKYFFYGILLTSITIFCTHSTTELNQKLIKAIRDINPELVQQLLNAGADVNTRTSFNYTVLMQASSGGINSELVPKDMPCCIHEDCTNASWWPAYAQLIKQQHAIICLLIKAGADLNLQNEEGLTALHFACIMNTLDPQRVALLIDAGINLDIQTHDGRTALMEAVIDGEREIVEMLLKAGADKDLKNSLGKTALDFARDYCGYGAIIELLQR